MKKLKAKLKRSRFANKLYFYSKYYYTRFKKQDIIIKRDDFKNNYLKDIKNSDFLYAENLEDYLSLLKSNQTLVQDTEELKSKISKFKEDGTFYIEGFNSLIGENDLFKIEHKNIRNGEINFKEFFTSVKMWLNGRLRFTYDVLCLILSKIELKGNEKIYIAEFGTQFYSFLKPKFKGQLRGSHYAGPNFKPGQILNGIMHQDLEHLSFESNSFKYCMTFEDLEHVVNYKKAIAELYRVLTSDGVLVITAPFNANSEKILERAYVDEQGKICHILEPEYHGDPVNGKGILCFRHFGWEFLDELRGLGFKHVKFVTGFFPEKMILGNVGVIVCSKEIPF